MNKQFLRSTLFALCALLILAAAACEPVASPTQVASITLDRQYIVHDQLYVGDEKITDGTTIYMNHDDQGNYNFLLPSFVPWEKWYVVQNGIATAHVSKLYVPASDITITEKVMPFGGVAVIPTITPIPDGVIVFHDQYLSENGQRIYIDGFYSHCIRSFGYGLPEQGGIFNQWYTIENGWAIKHEGTIELSADGYVYNETGWPILTR